MKGMQDPRLVAARTLEREADRLRQPLAQHAPDQATVTLDLTDDLFLRSFTWARWQLGMPLPVER